MNPPHTTDERAVFTQLKPVRMPPAEDPTVFEDVKPGVRVTGHRRRSFLLLLLLLLVVEGRGGGGGMLQLLLQSEYKIK